MGSSGQTTLNQRVSCKCTFKLVAGTAGSSKPVSHLRNHSAVSAEVTWRRGWNPSAWEYRGAVCPPGGPWRGWWGAGTGWPPPGGTAAQRTGQARHTANQLGITPNQGLYFRPRPCFSLCQNDIFPLPRSDNIYSSCIILPIFAPLVWMCPFDFKFPFIFPLSFFFFFHNFFSCRY